MAAKFKVGDKIKLDATVKAVHGETVTVGLDIITTAKDLAKFDDPQETTPILD